MVQEEGAVEQVHTRHAQGLLLQLRFPVQHAHMQHDLALLLARMALELEPHPAVAVLVVAKTLGRHGVGEHEERCGLAAGRVQAGQVLLVLVVEHALQPLARDVALGVAVDRVADRHVVSRGALGDSARCAAHPKKPARDLLTRADLGERTIAVLIQVDVQRLAVGIESIGVGKIAGSWDHGLCQSQATM